MLEIMNGVFFFFFLHCFLDLFHSLIVATFNNLVIFSSSFAFFIYRDMFLIVFSLSAVLLVRQQSHRKQCADYKKEYF